GRPPRLRAAFAPAASATASETGFFPSATRVRMLRVSRQRPLGRQQVRLLLALLAGTLRALLLALREGCRTLAGIPRRRRRQPDPGQRDRRGAVVRGRGAEVERRRPRSLRGRLEGDVEYAGARGDAGGLHDGGTAVVGLREVARVGAGERRVRRE